jgi:DNA-binding NarL/FixJ family response regulator
MEKTKPIRQTPKRQMIFLVEAHPVTRSGFALLLNREKDLGVCGEAATAAAAMTGIGSLKPDLVITDIVLPGKGGLQLARELAARHPQLSILVLSGMDETLYALRALRAGAKGYVMKEAAVGVILEAIRTVLAGEIYLSNKMRVRLFQTTLVGNHSSDPRQVEGSIGGLTDRELEVFHLIGQGVGTREIATQLHLSFSTVEAHRSNIKRKLGARNAPELMAQAINWLNREDFNPDFS